MPDPRRRCHARHRAVARRGQDRRAQGAARASASTLGINPSDAAGRARPEDAHVPVSRAASATGAAGRGVRGWFKQLEEKTYKMHVRIMLCALPGLHRRVASCGGSRLKPAAGWYRLGGHTLAEVLALTVEAARRWVLALPDGRVRARAEPDRRRSSPIAWATSSASASAT
ncbi:MAG: hypothetical protein V9G29_04375 [Burkholderiaceae bacterium]